jgi:hypothetical protein
MISIKLTKSQLTHALLACLECAIESSDIARLNAVHRIIEVERFQGFEGLTSAIFHDPVDFILIAAPGFSGSLKAATGKDRNEWAALIG